MTHQDQSGHWARSVSADTRVIYKKGLFTVGVFMLLFGVWACLFPLSSAVIAMGSVVPIGKSKTIQHLTGGTVAQIHVVDGQVVKAGDRIITLDPIVDIAELENLENQYALLQAMEARLVAQYAGYDAMTLPSKFFTQSGDKNQLNADMSEFNIRYDQLVDDQQREFVANRQMFEKELSELDQQINSFVGQLRSLISQKNNIVKQKEILGDQLQRMRPLVAEGVVVRNDFEEIERQYLQLSADYDEVNTSITSVKFSITETQDRKATTIASRRAEMSKELSRVRGEMDTVKSQVTAVHDSLAKRDIRAATDGILTKSVVHTIGGVVGPGEVIAEIVPAGGYTVEARVALQDIDYVQPGQTARIVVTAFNRKLYDPVPAIVEYVSADSELDEQTGERFFVTRLSLVESPQSARQIDKLRAGMQGEVYIITGERTFLTYVMKPLTDGFLRAFREN